MLPPSIYLQDKCKDYSGYFPTNRSVIVLTLVPNYSLGSSVLFRPKKRSHSEGRAKEERRHWPLLMTAVCLHLWPATGISEDPFETPSIAFRDKSIQLFLGKDSLIWGNVDCMVKTYPLYLNYRMFFFVHEYLCRMYKIRTNKQKSGRYGLYNVMSYHRSHSKCQTGQ